MRTSSISRTNEPGYLSNWSKSKMPSRAPNDLKLTESHHDNIGYKYTINSSKPQLPPKSSLRPTSVAFKNTTPRNVLWNRNNNYSPKVNEEMNTKENTDRLSSVKSRYMRDTPISTKQSQRETQKLAPFRTGVSVERNYQKEKEKAGIPPIVTRTVSNTLSNNSASKVNRLNTINQGINDRETSKYGNYQVPGTYTKSNLADLSKGLRALERTIEASRDGYNDSPVQETGLKAYEKPIYNGSSSNLSQGSLNYHAFPGRANKFSEFRDDENKEKRIESHTSNQAFGSSYQYYGTKSQSVLKPVETKNENKRESFSYTSEQSDKSASSNGAKIKEDYSSSYTSSIPRGLVGLRNIGNTCFMNSILQCLFNSPLFSDYFLKGSHKKEKNPKSKGLADAFASILEKMRNHSGSPSGSAETPSELKSKIARANPIFSGYEQHDAQELLKAVLEGINDDVNRVVTKPAYKELTADPKKKIQDISDEWFDYMLARDNSVITDLFCGQLMSKTICTHCNNESLAFDNFWDLALSFTKNSKSHLNEMLEQFLKEEMLEDLFYCEKCKVRRKSKKQFIIWRLPNILVIQLKRFEYTQYRRDKINKSVGFPVSSFDLKQFTRESTDPSVRDSKYTLFGIVNHGGSLYGGHYTAECMNPYDRKWYNFNDSSVRETHMKKDEAESSSPYILFYIKSSSLNTR